MSYTPEQFAKLMSNSQVQIAKGDLRAAPAETMAARIAQVEYEMQTTVFERLKMLAVIRPEYSLAFAVPNDMVRPGQRVTPGIKAGVPDIFWPVARGGYHGMFIELKVGRNLLSAEQQTWLDRLEMEGFFCVVIRNDAEAVIAEMESYLRLTI